MHLIKKTKLLPAMLISISFLSVALNNAHAQDQTQVETESTITQEPLSEDTTTSPYYRQELRKIISEKEEFQPQELDAYARYMPSSGAGSQSGKIGITDSAAEYSYEIKAFGQLPIQFAVGSRYIGIENSTVVQLPAQLTTVSFGAEVTLPFFNFDKTYLTIGIAPTFLSDNWNFHTESFSLMQRYFLIYQPNDKWTFVCGANYYPRFRQPVSPILGFIYKPNDRLTFNIIPETPEVSYLLNDKLTVFIQGDSTDGEYRVTKDNLKNVVLNYNEMHLGAGLRCKWNKNITGSFTAGGVFNRSIEYRQDSLGKVTVKNGFYTELRLVMAM
ncbi:MAG: DUF6268 family outer membrane beta-barrel protein [Candidatus Omnitrophica bacterium]|jgi:hypothetical protein|nr:DUF6268 family outer membrane beta-barrel protein [Candidatus Omnitrophota bacterium]